MDGKTLKLLAIVFVLLLGVVFYPTLQSRFAPIVVPTEFSFAAITRTQTKKITIQQGTEEITLTPEGNSWQVGTYSASLDKIDGLFAALKDAKPESIVSRNPSNSGDYGLASDSGTLVVFSGTAGETSVLVGSSGPTGTSFYAKKAGSNNVYLVDGTLNNLLTVQMADWRDRAIVRFTSDDVTALAMAGSINFELQKNADTSWHLTSATVDKKLVDADVKPVLDGLATLTATDFYSPDQASQIQQNSDKRMLVIKDKNGKVIDSLKIIPDGSDFLVIADSKADFYKVPGDSLSSLFSLPQK